VLDDRAGRGSARELGHQFEGSVGVVDVVVGQFLALPLPGGRHAGTARAVDIEGRRLVRVLAIAQRLGELARKAAVARGGLPDLSGEPGAYGRVIGRGLGIGGQRQLLAVGHCRGAIVGLQLGKQAVIVQRIGHHRDKPMVLRRRADHRRAADVDVLDAGRMVSALRHRLLEGVEVDDQQVDRFDPVRGHRHQMLVIVTQRQQAAMHLRVQRLDPAVHHFGKARHVRHVPYRQPRRAQHAAGATGGNQLYAISRQRAGQVQKAGLVGNRNQRAADGDEVGHRRNPSLCPFLGPQGSVSMSPRSRMASGVSFAFAKVQPIRVSKPRASPRSTICRQGRGLSRPFSR
jgi:hypothetical protein